MLILNFTNENFGVLEVEASIDELKSKYLNACIDEEDVLSIKSIVDITDNKESFLDHQALEERWSDVAHEQLANYRAELQEEKERIKDYYHNLI